MGHKSGLMMNYIWPIMTFFFFQKMKNMHRITQSRKVAIKRYTFSATWNNDSFPTLLPSSIVHRQTVSPERKPPSLELR